VRSAQESMGGQRSEQVVLFLGLGGDVQPAAKKKKERVTGWPRSATSSEKPKKHGGARERWWVRKGKAKGGTQHKVDLKKG